MTDEYTVGYKKPPEHTRFKPGQSGNPRGRRGQGPTDLVTGFASALAAPVTLREGTRTRQVSKAEAVFYQLRQQALSGDATAYDLLMHEAARCGLLPRVTPPDPNAPQGGCLLVPDPMTQEEWYREFGGNKAHYLEEAEKLMGRLTRNGHRTDEDNP